MGLNVSDDGYVAIAAVSGRQKTPALAGDCLGMIPQALHLLLLWRFSKRVRKVLRGWHLRLLRLLVVRLRSLQQIEPSAGLREGGQAISKTSGL